MNRDRITLGAKLAFKHYVPRQDEHIDFECTVVGFASNGMPIVEIQDGDSVNVFLVENLKDLSRRTRNEVWWGRIRIDSNYEPYFCGYFHSQKELDQQELPPGGSWFKQPQSLLVKVPVDD